VDKLAIFFWNIVDNLARMHVVTDETIQVRK